RTAPLEWLSGQKSAILLPADPNRSLSIGDDEEAHAAHVALLHHRGAGRDIAFAEEACELPPLAIVEAREERHPLEVFGDGRHSADATASSSGAPEPGPSRMSDRRPR